MLPNSAPHGLNRYALFSVAWLFGLIGAFYGVKALQTRVPAAAEVRSDTLSVDAIEMLVVERNHQPVGPALFLSLPKPDELKRSAWREDATTILFHEDLGLSQSDLDSLNALAPATMEVLTWNAVAVGLTKDGHAVLPLDEFEKRTQRARTVRWTAVAASFAAASIATLWGFRLPHRPRTPSAAGAHP